jgi:hypothetical protein
MALIAAVVPQFQSFMERGGIQPRGMQFHGLQGHRHDRFSYVKTLICLFSLCQEGTISARVDFEMGILALAFGER